MYSFTMPVRLEQSFVLTEQNTQDTKKISHGVSPETYEFLIDVKTYKAFRNIDPEIINLIEAYYSTEVSLRELSKSVGISRPTATKRILAGLNQAWEQLPSDTQLQHSKEKVIKLKDASTISPRVSNKKSEAAKALWGNKVYREKALASLRQRKNNPEFIQRMRDIGQARPPPMEGKTHTKEAIKKIQNSTQENWNKQHGIEITTDRLTKRGIFLGEWLRLSQLLGHSPSYSEITELKRERKTRFSVTMYKQEFGGGSFTKAKEQLDRLTTLAGPSFEAAQRLTGYLTSKSKELAKYGITEEDIQKHNAQIKEACDKILSATSEQETNQGMERLDLLLSRIQRKISIMTPFYKP